MRCHWCGVEPDAEAEVLSMESTQPIVIVQWPATGDHVHGERPPTPADLEDEAYALLNHRHG
jgi:hypothetical protein